MKTLIDSIKCCLKEAAAKAFGDLVHDFEPALGPATNPAFGDYQTNAALVLAGLVKSSPRDVAFKLVSGMDLSKWCQPPEIAGPGFINLRLTRGFLEEQVERIAACPRLGISAASPLKKIVVDMSSPNIAKEMHVGHLRSTIIGESLARIYAFLGHNVLKVNHVGDWGTQFGMLIAHLKEVCPRALDQADSLDLGDLVAFYKEAKIHFDADAVFQEKARQEVVRLQSGEAESIQAWELLCRQSRRAFEEIYDILDVHGLVERGESFYNPMLAGIVADLEKCGLAVENQGASCVFLEGFLNEEGNPLPLIVRKGDGGYNYATTDLAGVRYRVEHDHADELVYVVDAGQSSHFSMIEQVARRAGWLPQSVGMKHVPFGLVLGEGGKKLKTRSGETVRLKDLLEEAVLRARAELLARMDAEGRVEGEDFVARVAQTIGIGAVKYADLSLNRMTNYVFSFDKMLSFEGNTAPYMLYAFVRVQGISRKGGIDFSALKTEGSIKLADDLDLSLAKYLLGFDEVLESVVADCTPNRICEYVFGLAQLFSRFYEGCPVLSAQEPTRTSRLVLCDLTARTLKLGLSLLGVPVIERM